MTPWDTILEEGWAPEHCASMVLDHLRNDEVVFARRYWARLHELMRGELVPKSQRRSGPNHAVARAAAVMVRLRELLSEDERNMLG